MQTFLFFEVVQHLCSLTCCIVLLCSVKLLALKLFGFDNHFLQKKLLVDFGVCCILTTFYDLLKVKLNNPDTS